MLVGGWTGFAGPTGIMECLVRASKTTDSRRAAGPHGRFLTGLAGRGPASGRPVPAKLVSEGPQGAWKSGFWRPAPKD